MMTVTTAVIAASISITGVTASAAADDVLLDAGQVETALHYVWLRGGNDKQRFCAEVGANNAEQSGPAEMTVRFAPGQWLMRYSKAGRNRDSDFYRRRLDLLARYGLLEKAESQMNVGPLAGVPAFDYRVTVAGWVANERSDGGACFYFGVRDMPRLIDYKLSAPDAGGYRSVTINYVTAFNTLMPWAGDPEAAALFPELRNAVEGKAGTWTFYRAPDGHLELTRGSGEKLEGWPASRLRPVPAALDAQTVIEGIENTRRNPETDPNRGAPAPEPCLLLLHERALWQKGDSAAARAVTWESPPVSGSVPDRLIDTYARLGQLARAGLLSLNELPRAANGTRKFIIRPQPPVAEMLVAHGACLPLGETRIQVDDMRTDNNASNMIRFKARYIVTKPAPWLALVTDKTSLPDLAALIDHGYPFTGAVFKAGAGWRAGYLAAQAPEYRIPSLAAAGGASLWQRPGMPLVNVHGHDLQRIQARLPEEGQNLPRQPPGIPRHTVSIYVNPSQRPMVLLLDAYDHTHWDLTLSPQARVSAILVYGYEMQTVTGNVGSIPVIIVAREISTVDSAISTTAPTPDGVRLRLGLNALPYIETNGIKPVFVNGR